MKTTPCVQCEFCKKFIKEDGEYLKVEKHGVSYKRQYRPTVYNLGDEITIFCHVECFVSFISKKHNDYNLCQ